MSVYTGSPVTETALLAETDKTPTPGTMYKLFLLAAAYTCQAVPIRFCWVGLPVIFRQSGVGLQVIGWMAMLYLPWAFKFLWSPYVDCWWLCRLGRRRTWIFPLQWLAAALLVALTAVPPMAAPVSGFLVMLALNFVYATNDVAVDGYATDILTPRERAWGNSVQMGSMYLGQMLGGGGFVMLYGCVGWHLTLAAMAGLTLLLSLPIVCHREIAAVACPGGDTPGVSREKQAPRLWPFLKASRTRLILLWLVLVGVMAYGGVYMRLPMLSDLGYGSRQIGSLLLRYGYPFGIAGAILGGAIIRIFGVRHLLYAGGIAAVGLSVLTVHAVSGTPSTAEIAVMLAGEQLILGGIQVLVYTVIMNASAGPQAGTNYATLCSGFHLIFLCQAPIMGAIADVSGYIGLYMLLGAAFVVLLVLSDMIYLRIRR